MPKKPLPKRQCQGERKAGGPCGANPVRQGTVIAGVTCSGKWCIHHDPDLPESARIGGKQPGAGRPPAPRAVDVLRERIEANIDRVILPLFDALDAAGGFSVKYKNVDGEDCIEFVPHPDHGVRLKAVGELLDRAYGKPKQQTELSGPDGGPVPLAPIVIPDTDEYRRKVAQIAAQTLGVAVPDAADR